MAATSGCALCCWKHCTSFPHAEQPLWSLQPALTQLRDGWPDPSVATVPTPRPLPLTPPWEGPVLWRLLCTGTLHAGLCACAPLSQAQAGFCAFLCWTCTLDKRRRPPLPVTQRMQAWLLILSLGVITPAGRAGVAMGGAPFFCPTGERALPKGQAPLW